MKIRIIILGIVCLIPIVSLASIPPKQAQSDTQPSVVRAVPSVYPPIAMAARVSGIVIVEVKINAKGEVTSANAVEGHKLLQRAAEIAAKRWLFSPMDERDRKRSVRLTFSFILTYAADADLMPVFMPPYKVEVRDTPRRIVDTPNIDP